MSRFISSKIVLLFALAALTAGCGSGGGGDGGTTAPASSEWDSMIWDQDNWS